MRDGNKINKCGPSHLGSGHEKSDLVERLLLMAEEAPEIPPDGALRIKLAVEPIWTSIVQGQSRRRRLRWSIGLAAAAAVIIALAITYLVPSPQVIVASLEAVTGVADIESVAGEKQRAAADSIGLKIVSGSWLVTDTESRTAVRLANGQSLRLDVGSRLRLDSAQRMTLVRGAVYVDSGLQSEAGCVEIDTPLGVARDIGTQFEIRIGNGSLSILVREGRVALLRATDELGVAEGTALMVTSDGNAETSPLNPWAEEWDWVQEVVPVLEIEGMRLIVFLDWVSRESGRWITFTDSDTEALARSTVLHGTIEGLSPSRAVRAVLPSCGMKVREESGVFVVSRATSPVNGP